MFNGSEVHCYWMINPWDLHDNSSKGGHKISAYICGSESLVLILSGVYFFYRHSYKILSYHLNSFSDFGEIALRLSSFWLLSSENSWLRGPILFIVSLWLDWGFLFNSWDGDQNKIHTHLLIHEIFSFHSIVTDYYLLQKRANTRFFLKNPYFYIIKSLARKNLLRIKTSWIKRV